MGGLIAQEFALNHPGRVRSLVLAATDCGGACATLAQPKVEGGERPKAIRLHFVHDEVIAA